MVKPVHTPEIFRKLVRLSLIMGLGLNLGACANVATHLPDVSQPALKAEQKVQEKLAFAEMDRLQARLTRVAAPILSENTQLCPKVRRDIGAHTHTLKSYPKALRDAAARERGATDTPTILYVVPGSGAQKAGLRPGDEILGPLGKPVSVTGKTIRNLLDGAERGPITLDMRRGDRQWTVSLTPQSICDYKINLTMRSTVNAYANGRGITLTSGMMNFTQSDAELGLVIAHELAHNTMGHVRKIVSNMILSGFARRYARPFESEADYVGLYYLTRAGYSPDNVEDIWKRMALIGPKSVARAKSHPTYPDRFLRLAAARDEIDTKLASDLPLIPNFKSGETPPSMSVP